MSVILKQRKCKNCTYYTCPRLECYSENVCNEHEFEHEVMIKEIDEKSEED